MNLNLVKGNELESAVLKIEQLLLSQLKENHGAKVHVINKHKERINGVLHEIDLFVEVDLGNDYKAIYLFECKNWSSAKVSKNEILVFSEKIRAFNATHGFFIGTRFTEDAMKQAVLDKRMSTHLASEYNLSPLKYAVLEDPYQRKLNEILFYEFPEIDGQELNIVQADDTVAIRLNGDLIDYSRFIHSIINLICTREFVETHAKEAKRVKARVKHTILFKAGALTVDGEVFRRVDADIEITIERCVPEVNFGFEVNGRGYYIDLGARLESGTYLHLEVTAGHIKDH